jgi:hypothetical protein
MERQFESIWNLTGTVRFGLMATQSLFACRVLAAGTTSSATTYPLIARGTASTNPTAPTSAG